MAFTVEDGTGLASATSLVAVADADAHWANRPRDTRGVAWVALTGPTGTTTKEDALTRASDYFRAHPRWRWRGIKLSYVQRMPFPRTGCTEFGGQAVPENVVPWQVAEGVIVLAARLVSGEVATHEDLERGGRIKSESVGPISTTYMDDAPIGTTITEVEGLIRPLLLDAGTDVPTSLDMEHVPIPDVFRNDAFAPYTTSANYLTDP